VKKHLLLVGILLVAAALRLILLAQLPPGAEHDEVDEVLIAQSIWRGQHALFFRQAYGQEPLFLYLAAGALAVLGGTILALRFVTAAVGMLTVAAGFRLARRWFGVDAALITAAGLGVMLWPVFWSRVGLRGMLLPLTLCLGVDALWRAMQDRERRIAPINADAVLAGLLLGLSGYTYLAARGVPILFGAFLVYLALFNRALLRRAWRELAIALTLAAVIALPLGVYLVLHPQVQFRVGEVNAPLLQLVNGNPGEALANAPRVLGLFSVSGDSTVRNNFPDRPVFPEPVWATFFYAGLLAALYRWRDARYGFVLLWLGVMLTPTLVTTDAPNFVRTLGALPAVMMLPGIVLTMFPACSYVLRTAYCVLAVAFVLNAGLTVNDYFFRWPQIPETQFVWQTDLSAIARTLDADPQIVDVTAAGLSNNSLDAPTLELLMQRDDVRMRWVDTGSPLGAGGALVVPQNGGRLLIPSIVPLNPDLNGLLQAWGAQRIEYAHFTEFRLATPEWTYEAVESFESNISLLWTRTPSVPVQAGQTVKLLTAWQAGTPPYPPLKIAIHLVDAAGTLRAQHDGLDSPAQFWQPGDVIVQAHWMALPTDLPPGDYKVRVSLYNRDTLQIYHLTDGRADLIVATIQVYNPQP
jgi:4-amino-4-deoxy-L-arabinose transferase-like glycosyltransferase